MIARSLMGKSSPRVNLNGEEVFVAVRTFLDSSGQSKDKCVTLGALAATDEVWADFERGWNEVLGSGFLPVPYMHMVEAVGLRDRSPFDKRLGWDKEKAFALIWKLVMYMQNLDKTKFRIAWCEIDMDTLREMSSQGMPVPDEITLCNRYCPGMVMPFFLRKAMEDGLPIETEFHFIFDRNERFMKPFKAEWNKRLDLAQVTGVYTSWQAIHSIAEVRDMKDSPGIQAADMVAWSVNRENRGEEGQAGFMMAHIMRQVLPHFAGVFDREKLMNDFATQEKADETKTRNENVDKFNAAMDQLLKVNPELVRQAMAEEKAERGVKRNNRLKPSPLDRARSNRDA